MAPRPSPAPSLTLRAGPDALRHLRERGLRAADVDVLPGASGGAKWLALAGLDRFLFGTFFQEPRRRPLHCIGSSIGSWRMACLAQRDPAAALARGHQAYIHRQGYSSHRPSTAEVSAVLGACLGELLGAGGVDEILAHPWARLHVITAEARGPAASERRGVLTAALALAAAGNLVGRRMLALQLTRCVFHSAGDATPFAHLRDLPTVHRPLTRDNLRAALQASGSIPLLMDGVRVPGAPGLHWDGGVLDYHLDLDFAGARLDGPVDAVLGAAEATARPEPDAGMDARVNDAAAPPTIAVSCSTRTSTRTSSRGGSTRGCAGAAPAARRTPGASAAPCSSPRRTRSSRRSPAPRSPTARTSTRTTTPGDGGGGRPWSTRARGWGTSSPNCWRRGGSPTPCAPGRRDRRSVTAGP
jgi:hypothetical protein